MKISRLSLSILFVAVLVFTGQSCGAGNNEDATGVGGVYYSDDLGETWIAKNIVIESAEKTSSLEAVDITKFRIDPKNRDIIYITTADHGIYKTFNRGEQWIQTGITTALVRDLQIHPLNSEILYITYGTSILKSSDAGSTWEEVYTDPEGGEPMRIAIDWFNPQRIIIGTSQGVVLLSEDEGVNWTVTYDVEGPITDLLMSRTDSRFLYITEFERSIHISEDGGENWKNIFTRQLKEGETDKEILAKQKQWDDFLNENPGFLRIISIIFDENNSETLYAVTGEGLFMTRDRGENWTYITTLLSKGSPESPQINGVATIPGAPDLLYFTLKNEVHKSADRGATWKVIEDFPAQSIINTIIPEQQSPEDTESNVLFAVTENPPKPKRSLFQVVPSQE